MSINTEILYIIRNTFLYNLSLKLYNKKMTLEANIPKICCIDGCSSPSRKKGLSKLGFPLYKKHCRKHDVNTYIHKYRMFKKDKCENCGFIPAHSCQLDVDHIDGNKKNNNIDNLKTLCANCHRLKTHINQEYKKRQPNEGLP